MYVLPLPTRTHTAPSWTRRVFVGPQLPSRLFDEMPCIWLKPSKKEDDDGSAAKTYTCPLYKTSLRVRDGPRGHKLQAGRTVKTVPQSAVERVAAALRRLFIFTLG